MLVYKIRALAICSQPRADRCTVVQSHCCPGLDHTPTLLICHESLELHEFAREVSRYIHVHADVKCCEGVLEYGHSAASPLILAHQRLGPRVSHKIIFVHLPPLSCTTDLCPLVPAYLRVVTRSDNWAVRQPWKPPDPRITSGGVRPVDRSEKESARVRLSHLEFLCGFGAVGAFAGRYIPNRSPRPSVVEGRDKP